MATVDLAACLGDSLAVEPSSWYERLFQGSGSERAILVVVSAMAVVFVGYLVIDGLYHKLKWRRLQRKFREANENPERPA